jgi:hypothetical protein
VAKGRPTKLTPETQKKITDALQLGATYEHACNYAGIAYNTFNEWMKHKPDFNEIVKEAEGKATVGWLARIEQAAKDGAWQAAAWKLERRYPHDYGRTVSESKVELEISGGVNLYIPDNGRDKPE